MDNYYQPNNKRRKYAHLLWVIFCSFLLMGCKPVSKEARDWCIKASESFNLYPIVHKGLVVLAGKCGNADCLKAVRMDTGAPVWNWLDSDSILHKSYYNLKHYIFDDVLLLPIGSRLIAISLADGNTLWQDQRSWPAESFVEGTGSRALRTYYDQENRVARILAFDVYSGVAREIKTFSLPAEGRLSARTPVAAVLDGKDTICISSTIHFIPNINTRSRLIFWHLNNPSFQETIEVYPDNLSGDGVTKQGIVDGTRSYWAAGNQVVCIDLENRKELWRDTFPQDMLTSRLLLDNGQLFYACENEVLYALEAENGQIRWQCPIAGTPSRVYVDKGKVFLVGGSDGKLYVIDRNSGRLLFKYQPASLGFENGNSFRRAFYAGDDKLIVTDYKSWRAFHISENGWIEMNGDNAGNR